MKRLSDGPHPPEHYLLSPADMAEMDYPIPTLRGREGEGGGGRRRRRFSWEKKEKERARRGPRGVDVVVAGRVRGDAAGGVWYRA